MKGHLSPCERWPFTVQKAVFHNAKDGLSQSRPQPPCRQAETNKAAEKKKTSIYFKQI
jgi:hypothetical protein